MSSDYPIRIDQGADWAAEIQWSTGEMTPFYVLSPMRMEIRHASSGVLLAALQTDDLGETTEDTINYNSDSGLIQLRLNSATTRDFPPGTYMYDLFVTYSDGGTARLHRLLYGSCYVSGRVTQNIGG